MTAHSPANRSAATMNLLSPASGSPSLALSVVIPCYNETSVLSELHQRVSHACRAAVGNSYEILLVDDGSRDGTREAMRALADTDYHVHAVLLSRNPGHQLVLTAGLSLCRGLRIFILDADLQDEPELLPEMLSVLFAGADVVYGQRRQHEGESMFKRGTAALFYRLLSRLVDIDIPVDTGDFRLMSARALAVLNAMPEQHRFVRGMVSWVGMRQVPFPYDRKPRLAGDTKYPLGKMLRFAVDAITGFSIKPLRLAIPFGAVFGVSGLLLLAYTLSSWAFGAVVAGWTSLMVVVLLLGSAQLFVLGVMGEYLGRLFLEAKRRPLFVIEEVYAGNEAAKAPAGGR